MNNDAQMVGTVVTGFSGWGQRAAGVAVAYKPGLGILVRVEPRPGFENHPLGDQDRGLYVYTGDVETAGTETPYQGVEDMVKWSLHDEGWRLDGEYIEQVTKQFLSLPTWEEQEALAEAQPAARPTCYYCGMPATGFSLGERACKDCGG